MNPKYKYTTFDVETTWLDNKNDHIIQIWLIQFDHNFEIIQKFESYINPGIEIEKLKSIVWFITNIDPSQLWGFPQISEFEEQIQWFFGSDVVVIGHNIQFDIWFVRKCMDITYNQIIDTLPLARNLLHYIPSYAQESIHNHLLSNPVKNVKSNYSHYINIYTEWNTKHHDAMYDSLVNLSIFRYFVDYIYSLTSYYPRLANHLADDKFWNIFGNWEKKEFSYHIPHFSLIHTPKANTSNNPICDISKLKSFDKVYIWDLEFEEFMLDLVKNNKIIISTNSASKLQIIKSILVRNSVKWFGFLKPSQSIDNDLLDNWIKTDLNTDELWFLVKYISHHYVWLSVLDLNCESDYQVYNLIRKDSEISAENIVLCTHNGLFANLENDFMDDYAVAFLDNDRWYSSMLKYVSKPIDIMNMVYIFDNIRYKYNKLYQIQKLKNLNLELKDDWVVNQLEYIYERFLVFFGNINMEMQKYLANKKADDDGRYKIESIGSNNENFKASKMLFLEIIERLEILWEWSDFMWKDYEILLEQITKIQNIFTKFTTVFLKVDFQWYREYVYINNNNYVTYDEFRTFMKKTKTVVFTNYDKIGVKLNLENQDKKDQVEGKTENQIEQNIISQTINNVNNFDEILQKLAHNDTAKLTDHIYIFSNSKSKSKGYFDKIIAKWVDKNYDIYIENITWWVGKILWLAEKSKKFILIWWYELYMSAIAKNVNISDIYIIGNIWLMHNQIINDMKYYT